MGDDVADVVAGCAVLLYEVQNVLPPGVHPLMTCFYLYEKRIAALRHCPNDLLYSGLKCLPGSSSRSFFRLSVYPFVHVYVIRR